MAHQEGEEEEVLLGGGSPTETLDPSDPSLSRNVSFSKLNARAPEFVPTRPDPPPPPPPPPAMMHMYPPPPPFHVPIHLIPVQDHPRPHRPQQQQHVPVRNHSSNHHQHHVPVINPHPHHQNHHYSSRKCAQLEDDGEVLAKKDKTELSDEAVHKLINQVEYYFSDLNLATTDHLMRHITKDPEGYVPLQVVTNFKKIKAAVSSEPQLATILRSSPKLTVSKDGKKVKRVHPLTESDVEELQSRIVVAENLPEDHCHQNLMKIFSAVGSVKTIRTCLPQTSGAGPSSASRSAKADGMHFSNKLHAFVEYNSVETAEKAVVELNDEGNWRSGLRVQLMLKRNSKPDRARGKKGHNGQGHSEEDEVSTSEQLHEKQTEDSSHQHDVCSHERPGEDHANDKESVQRKGCGKGRGKGHGRGQHHHNNRGNHVGMPPSNSVVVNEQAALAKQPPGPRMPDGTRGFATGRGKPVAVNMS